jgi:hypothetical protein
MQVHHNGHTAEIAWEHREGWKPAWWIRINGAEFPFSHMGELGEGDEIKAAEVVRCSLIGEPPPDDLDGYTCSDCGAVGVRLWRESHTWLEYLTLRCKTCASASQGGKPERGDQIGHHVPAVPTPDGSTFWSYGSVPLAAGSWWRALPLAAEHHQGIARPVPR